MKGKGKETSFAAARVAMGDSRTVARLSSPGLMDALRESRSAGKALEGIIGDECRELEKRIGAEEDPLLRKQLIRSRRRIRGLEGLASDPSDGAQRVAAAKRAFRTLEDAANAAFHQALADGRTALRALCQGDDDFRLSVLMSSASLSERLESWKSENDADPQRDVTLLRYWTRYAMKISPFSRFTGVACMEPRPVAGGIQLVPVSGAATLARLNVQILEQLEALRVYVPALGESTPIAVNSTLVWQNDWRVSYISSGLKGVINDLDISVPQARMLRRLQHLGETSWEKACPVILLCLKVPLGEVRGVIQEMLEREIMVRLSPAHAMEPDWLEPWIDSVKKIAGRGGADGGAVETLANSLGRLKALQSQGLPGDYQGRKSHLVFIRSAYAEMLSLAPAPAPESGPLVPLRKERLLYEDVGIRLDLPIPISGYNEVCRILANVAWAFTGGLPADGRFPPALNELVAHGDVSFMEFLRSWTAWVSLRPEAPAAKPIHETEGSRWLRSELERAKAGLPLNPGKGNPSEVSLSSSGIRGSGVDRTEKRRWHSCVVQKEGEEANARLVLNSGIAVGPMRLWSRFCDLFPSGVVEWLQASLADPDDGTLHAEIVDWNYSNANLHPILTKCVVLLSHRKPAGFRGKVIRIADLTVTRGDDEFPRLYCSRMGKYIIPVDMGFQGIGGHSPVYELLDLMRTKNRVSSDSIGGVARECFGAHTPRIVLDGRIVLAREAWHFARSDLQGRRKGQNLAGFFSDTLDWCFAHGLPNEVFVRLTPSPAAKDEALRNEKPRRRGADDYKPTYHRFDSALFLTQWERLVDKADDGMRIVEALPASAGNMTMGSTRHCCELVINWK